MKKIVITGVGGFIGSSLAKELIKDNVVYGLDIKKSDNILAFSRPLRLWTICSWT